MEAYFRQTSDPEGYYKHFLETVDFQEIGNIPPVATSHKEGEGSGVKGKWKPRTNLMQTKIINRSCLVFILGVLVHALMAWSLQHPQYIYCGYE